MNYLNYEKKYFLDIVLQCIELKRHFFNMLNLNPFATVTHYCVVEDFNIIKTSPSR